MSRNNKVRKYRKVNPIAFPVVKALVQGEPPMLTDVVQPERRKQPQSWQENDAYVSALCVVVFVVTTLAIAHFAFDLI